MSGPKEFELNNEGDVIALYSRETNNPDPYLDPPHPGWIELPASPSYWDWHDVGEAMATISLFLFSVSMFIMSLALLALVGGGLAGFIQ